MLISAISISANAQNSLECLIKRIIPLTIYIFFNLRTTSLSGVEHSLRGEWKRGRPLWGDCVLGSSPTPATHSCGSQASPPPSRASLLIRRMGVISGSCGFQVSGQAWPEMGALTEESGLDSAARPPKAGPGEALCPLCLTCPHARRWLDQLDVPAALLGPPTRGSGLSSPCSVKERLGPGSGSPRAQGSHI